MIITIQPIKFVTDDQTSFGFRISDSTRTSYADGFASMEAVRDALAPNRLVLTVLALCPDFGILESRGYLSAVRVGETLIAADNLEWPETF